MKILDNNEIVSIRKRSRVEDEDLRTGIIVTTKSYGHIPMVTSITGWDKDSFSLKYIEVSHLSDNSDIWCLALGEYEFNDCIKEAKKFQKGLSYLSS